jgi:hypothetical protein
MIKMFVRLQRYYERCVLMKSDFNVYQESGVLQTIYFLPRVKFELSVKMQLSLDLQETEVFLILSIGSME